MGVPNLAIFMLALAETACFLNSSQPLCAVEEFDSKSVGAGAPWSAQTDVPWSLSTRTSIKSHAVDGQVGIFSARRLDRRRPGGAKDFASSFSNARYITIRG